MFKLRIHSLVDVITNSSTTIYTWQDGSVEPCKELVNAFCQMAGLDKTCDDMFYVYSICDEEHYMESDGLTDELLSISDWKEQSKAFKEYVLDIVKSKKTWPQWMIDVESKENNDSYNVPDSYFCIIPKSDEYAILGKRIDSFLNSAQYEGGYNG